jgi:hypothetical protein
LASAQFIKAASHADGQMLGVRNIILDLLQPDVVVLFEPAIE